MNDTLIRQDLLDAADIVDTTPAPHPDAHHEDHGLSARAVAAVLLGVLLALGALGASVAFYGPQVLGLTALALVPVIFLVLILITVGK